MVRSARPSFSAPEEPHAIASQILTAAIASDFDLATQRALHMESDELRERVASRIDQLAQETWPDADSEAGGKWRVVLESGDPETTLFNLAVALWGVDELGIAIEAMRVALSRGDRSIEGMLGEAELFMGKIELAQGHLESAIARSSASDPHVAGLLGRIFFRHGARVDDATFALLEFAGASDDGFALDLAELNMARGDVASAIRILREQSAKGFAEVPILLGNFLIDHQHDFDGAQAAYLRGIELGDAHSAYNLAAILENAGHQAEANEWLEYAAANGDRWARERLESLGE